MTVIGFTTVDKIYEGEQVIVFRALRDEDQHPVILKTLRGPYPSRQTVARFQREFELTSQLTHEGIIDTYSLDVVEGVHTIVLEDFAGSSLDTFIGSKRLTVRRCLDIAVQLINALEYMHSHKVIHKDINPSNIVWNPSTQTMKVIDFGISSNLSRETMTAGTVSIIEGTLAYVSPEQTGRMNRVLDYRADYYSLGATLYELITGRLPFESSDPLEMVHAQIARLPIPPHQLDSSIPAVLSDILLKLLAKNAEDRYQSAAGLRADFQECLNRLDGSHIEPFEIAKDDYAGQLNIPQKLYGRGPQVEALTQCFERVSRGRCEIVFVAGYAGIGKTSLVNEVHKVISAERGSFVSGKFDQFNRGIPYASLADAFKIFIRQILGESDRVIEEWRAIFLNAVGKHGQILIDVLPQIELIIGAQNPVESLPPVEAENRFHLIFRRFVRALGGEGRPMVVFLDDLQWADLPSIRLLAHLVLDRQTKHLLFVGAYRDNEVSGAHPLLEMIEKIGRKGVSTTTLTLDPLTQEYVQAILSETLLRDSSSIRALAKLCFDKTQGNPFFFNQFLHSLAGQKLLSFDHSQRRWNWDLEEIRAQQITDNVIDLMVEKIKQLGAKTQTLLITAAIIGNTFTNKQLASLQQASIVDIDLEIQSALQEELIVHTRRPYREQPLDNDEEEECHYRFLHDRVQQAAYSLIEKEESRSIHLRFGRLVKSRAESLNDSIFEIVNHMNQATALLKTQEERDELADLNLIAGQRAKAAAAYQPAYESLRTGIRLLGKACWTRRPKESPTFYLEAAECALLSTDFEAMDALINQILTHSQDVLVRSAAVEIRILSLIARDRLKEALVAGITILRDLGIRLPEAPGQLNIISGLMGTKVALRGKKSGSIVSLPKCEDSQRLSAFRVLSNLGGPAYFSVPELVPLLSFKLVTQSLRYGLSPESSYGFVVYALVLCSIGEIDSGYEYGQTGIKLSKLFDDQRLAIRSTHVFFGFTRHWKEPISAIIADYPDVFLQGVETGELEYASYSAMMCTIFLYYSGQDLKSAHNQIERFTESQRGFKQAPSLDVQLIFHQAVVNLLDSGSSKSSITGDYYNEEEKLPTFATTRNDPTKLFVYYCVKTHLSVLFADYQAAAVSADEARKYFDGGQGTFHLPVFHYVDSIAQLASYSEKSPKTQRLNRKKVADNLKKLKKWASHCPANHEHRVSLIEAECARINEKPSAALQHYDDAIAAAKKNGFLNDEALANELAARFHLGRNSKIVGRAYLNEAYYRYEEWGANSKLDQLTAEFPWLLTGTGQVHYSKDPTKDTSSHTATDLDLSAVMRASQAISKEIILTQLVHKLMRIVLEVGGAQKGLLLREQETRLIVECEGIANNEVNVEIVGRPLEFYNGCPRSIIKYVQNTREDVVLGNAHKTGLFTEDPVILRNKIRSVLCLPVLQQNELGAILYLENNLSTDAFSKDRIDVLRVLLSQAAISIENAQLYNTLELRVEERTQELQNEIKERIRIQEELRRLATTDGLTKASNRRHFLELSEKEFQRAKRYQHPMSVIMIDADHFKDINDTFGHDIGDTVLQELTKSVLKELRNSDLFGRIGGEEFAATLPETDEAAAILVAERLRETIESLVLKAGDEQFHFTVSIGIAMLGEKDPEFSTILKRADSALYKAKETGRNKVILANPPGE
ncbi:MAG: diguanylate cyclase [Planctomycetota bacterium]|nr:diguanylate cyclase [Planctomycetota bacterium]